MPKPKAKSTMMVIRAIPDEDQLLTGGKVKDLRKRMLESDLGVGTYWIITRRRVLPLNQRQLRFFEKPKAARKTNADQTDGAPAE